MLNSSSPRLLILALVVSLGGNTLLGGYLWHQREHHGRRPGPPTIDGFVERLAAQLPEADAAILRQAFAPNRAAIAAEEQGRETFHQEIGALLRADPYDPGSLSRFLLAMDQREQEKRVLMRQSLVKATAEMSSEGRRRLAEARP